MIADLCVMSSATYHVACVVDNALRAGRTREETLRCVASAGADGVARRIARAELARREALEREELVIAGSLHVAPGALRLMLASSKPWSILHTERFEPGSVISVIADEKGGATHQFVVLGCSVAESSHGRPILYQLVLEPRR